MQNILAFSGVLGVVIEEIVLHTVYRNDKVNDMVNPVKMHLNRHCKGEWQSDWNADEIVLHFLDKQTFKHDRIKLNIETGAGEYRL